METTATPTHPEKTQALETSTQSQPEEPISAEQAKKNEETNRMLLVVLLLVIMMVALTQAHQKWLRAKRRNERQ